LDTNDVFENTFSGVLGKGYEFSSDQNAWRNDTGIDNGGGNVSTIQPPASLSLNNWMY